VEDVVMYMRVMVAAAFLATAGCNTVEGFGRDLAAVGGTVSKGATDSRTGRTKVITKDPAACLPDSHGKIPSGQCGATRTTVRAKQPVRTTTAGKAAPASAAQLEGAATPVKAEGATATAGTKPKLGWWQPACGKPGERPCSRSGQ
jgi:predicted small secreted protein